MTWGFVTCGPNEALVVSGSYFSVIEVDVNCSRFVLCFFSNPSCAIIGEYGRQVIILHGCSVKKD
jgi:hypothetical protein